MNDFGTVHNTVYRQYDHEDDITVKKEFHSVWPYAAATITLIFMIFMSLMMWRMVSILEDMDSLMKSTSSNTYAMCSLTKKISFDNSTLCFD